MKKSLKKSLLVGLSVLMCGAFLAGCGNDSKNAENKDTLKVAVTNFASSLVITSKVVSSRQRTMVILDRPG